MQERIRIFIVDFFTERGKFEDIDKNHYLDLNFFELKMLDSIEFITLISDIEEQFNIVFTELELQSNLFMSINGITQIVSKQLNLK